MEEKTTVQCIPLCGIDPRRKKRRTRVNVSTSEVMTWRHSINHILGSKKAQLVFMDFLYTEYSEENLQFWQACEEFKKISSSEEMIPAAKRINDEFVLVDAPSQINIDWETREEIVANISNPGKKLFDRAQALIYAMLEHDCYPRFLRSEIYLDLLQRR